MSLSEDWALNSLASFQELQPKVEKIRKWTQGPPWIVIAIKGRASERTPFDFLLYIFIEIHHLFCNS